MKNGFWIACYSYIVYSAFGSNTAQKQHMKVYKKRWNDAESGIHRCTGCRDSSHRCPRQDEPSSWQRSSAQISQQVACCHWKKTCPYPKDRRSYHAKLYLIGFRPSMGLLPEPDSFTFDEPLALMAITRPLSHMDTPDIGRISEPLLNRSLNRAFICTNRSLRGIAADIETWRLPLTANSFEDACAFLIFRGRRGTIPLAW